MPPKKKPRKKPAKKAAASEDDMSRFAHLPGYFMIAYGLIALGLNFDMLPGLEWAKAYPLFAVLLGVVVLVKLAISR